MSVWLCHQIYKNNFFKHIFNLFPLMIPGDSAALSDGAEAFFWFDVLLRSTHTPSGESVHAQTHTHQEHLKTSISVITGDRRADFTWYAGCCCAVMWTHPAELGDFQLWHLVLL